VLKGIQNFFNQFLDQNTAAGDTEHRLQLATAALLIEVMRTDDQDHEQEQAVLLSRLQQKFQIEPDRCTEIIRLAESEISQSTDYHQFTRLINEQFSQQQKTHVIELMWEIAWADGELDPWEEHLIRRVADLIYISHADFIAAKLAATPK